MKNLLIIVIASLFLMSCGSQEALKFNDKLVVMQNNLMLKINTSKAGAGNNVNNLKKVKDFAKEKIEEAKALKAPSGGEDFKNAMIQDFQFVYDIYDLTIKLSDPKISEAEAQKLETELTALEAKVNLYDNKVIEEQRKFAKKYNMEIKY